MNRKNKDLRVVRDSEDVDKLVRRIMDNTEDEETQMAQLEEQVKAHKKKIRIRILTVVTLIVAASVGIYLFIHLQTYTNVRVANTYPEAGSTDSNYKEFSEGVIRYSRDGMAYLSQQGEEKWNQAYQIKTPTVVAGCHFSKRRCKGRDPYNASDRKSDSIQSGNCVCGVERQFITQNRLL